MFCNKCGTFVPDDALFCQKCGVRLSGEAKRVTVTPVEPKADREGIFSPNGRRNRKPFNQVLVCLCFINSILARLIENSTSGVMVLILTFLSLILVYVAIINGVKRLHDIDLCGWWLLVPFVGIYIIFKKGTEGPNRYGPDPLA